jgi:DNA-binding transcriptional LysR family regulator
MLAHDDLALVLAISEGGRMKRAAEALRTHPATVYRRLEALELRIGGRLFERLDGRLVPTALAEEIAAAARQVAGLLDGLNRHVAARDERLTGTLSVTTTDTLQALTMPVLAAFGRLHPGLELRVGIANAMADLGRNEADIAIRPTRAPNEMLVGSQLGGFDYAVYTQAARALPAPMPMLTASAGWVVYDGAIAQTPAARWLSENVPAQNRIVAVDAMLAAALAARSGAYALLPSYLGEDPIFGLTRISPPIAELRSQVWLLTHPDLRYGAKVRAFMDIAGNVLRKALREG